MAPTPTNNNSSNMDLNTVDEMIQKINDEKREIAEMEKQMAEWDHGGGGGGGNQNQVMSSQLPSFNQQQQQPKGGGGGGGRLGQFAQSYGFQHQQSSNQSSNVSPPPELDLSPASAQVVRDSEEKYLQAMMTQVFIEIMDDYLGFISSFLC